MKKIITAVALLLATCTLSYAQCDKKVVLTASKTEYLGTDSTVQKSVDENTEVVFDKTSLVVTTGQNGDHVMTARINSTTCDWKIPYKEGKTVLKTTFADGSEAKNVTITITGKDGKLIFTAQVEGEDRIIKLAPDKFEEKKS